MFQLDSENGCCLLHCLRYELGSFVRDYRCGEIAVSCDDICKDPCDSLGVDSGDAIRE